ncbi:3-hydroxyacyl-CoA dehydrogenase NAD-binding domain-containing protein [Terrimonas rubra]|uniref:3-hydroxyacyl-CoA dehydrogenase NAD-binding domain-containing protein n=1 Tax=Terrimonas rubra TaxID=1035890 RepID=A0ABW6A134_9BACT
MTIQTICVCGAGTMGSGIAQVAATAGFTTLLYDVNADMLQKAKAGIEGSLQKLVSKEKITPDQQQQTIGRLRYITDINQCIAEVFIEAIVEKMEVKLSLFNQLAGINTPETIFASNTSSLSITRLAAQISHPERVVGLHFFNPAPLMKLVEVVKTEFNTTATITQMEALVNTMQKTPVVCKDSPGFIVNRVARPYYIEALRLAEEGLADFAQIDELMESTGFKMGPFALMDLIGNDINYAVSCSVYEQLQQPERLKPSYIQEEKVKKGELGRKSGKGYYNY